VVAIGQCQRRAIVAEQIRVQGLEQRQGFDARNEAIRPSGRRRRLQNVVRATNGMRKAARLDLRNTLSEPAQAND
jgi:hypothetical protein